MLPLGHWLYDSLTCGHFNCFLLLSSLFSLNGFCNVLPFYNIFFSLSFYLRWNVKMRLIRSPLFLLCCALLLLPIGSTASTASSIAAASSMVAASSSVDVDDDSAVTTSGHGCPRSCECKWKRGKETVTCVNTGFTFVPRPIDAGTQVSREIENSEISLSFSC